MRTLYPELTDDEYTHTITPLRRQSITPRSSGAIADLTELPGAFGPEHEAFTFQTVCAAIAGHYWNTTWTRGASPLAETQIERLAIEVFNMAIRPLADAMRDFASYEQFSATLLRSGFSDFAQAYPVLWGRLELRLTRKVRALLELLDRLEDDRETIEAHIGIPRSAAITAVDASGDTRKKGNKL